MSLFHYYVIEIDLPEVSGNCTINGNPGFSTPLTCTDQTSFSTTIKTHKFTGTGLILAESDIHKCVTNVTETTPKLKAGNGVASRATCNVTFANFIGDPNMGSPALTANPSLELNGSFFGKCKARNILTNKPLRVLKCKCDDGVHSVINTNHYILVGFKQNKNGTWQAASQDVLYKADDEKSQFPRIVTASLAGDITTGTTTVNINANIADWTDYDKYTAVIGDDLLMITNATGDADSVALTVVRATSITLGSRLIINEPSDHSFGDEVFRGRKFVNADLYDVLAAIFEDSDIKAHEYNGTEIAAELDSWLGSLDGSIDAIFYEADDSTSVLDKICQAFMLDIWTDTSVGKITLKAASPWSTTTAVLIEGQQITYGTVEVDEPSDLFYSRAFLQYDKRKLTEGNEDTSFKRSSISFNKDLEGPLFYDEEKVKRLGKSIILSNKTSNIEVADLTSVRYAQRFSNRPQTIQFEVEEADLNFKLGDVIEVLSDENQDIYGNRKQGVRVQVVHIAPSYNVGRVYKVSTVTFNPFIGGASGSDFGITSIYDTNLFTVSGGPVSAGTYTFIFDGGTFGQSTLSQAIAIGSLPIGSTVNVVLINGAIANAAGGFGGAGNAGNGGNGGTTIAGTHGVIVNIYLSGATPDFGDGSYIADGYLHSPGGGGSGAISGDESVEAWAAGGGGLGFVDGTPGVGSKALQSLPQSGNEGGAGAVSEARGETSTGGRGGVLGEDGQVGSGETVGVPGLAGKAIVKNGGTFNVITNGETSRFIRGSGDAPDSIS